MKKDNFSFPIRHLSFVHYRPTPDPSRQGGEKAGAAKVCGKGSLPLRGDLEGSFILHSSFFILLSLLSCGSPSRSAGDADTTAVVVDTMELHYAKGFRVRTLDNGIRLVDVEDPQKDEDRMPVSYHFALVPKDPPPYPSRQGGETSGLQGYSIAPALPSLTGARKKELSVLSGLVVGGGSPLPDGRGKGVGLLPAPPSGGEPRCARKLRASLSPLPDGRGKGVGLYTPIHVPVSRTIVMTMLQLSNFTALDALDVVRGITGTKNLFNTDVRQRVNDGRIVKIGMEGNFDTELILAAQPEVIFISPFKRGGYDAIKETCITLIPHLGYKELHPLGQAEWVKFVGLFLGKEREADSLFAQIEQRYNTLKEKTHLPTISRPTVFSGEMHGGNWYAVGGKSALAQLFRDAGAEYIVRDDNTGGVNIEFEQLYAQAANADFWRILNSYPGRFSYEALRASEPRNGLFRAFRERKVIYCNMRQTPYYELSPMQPDVLLADLIAIFHPDLMPADYQPTFYRLLR